MKMMQSWRRSKASTKSHDEYKAQQIDTHTNEVNVRYNKAQLAVKHNKAQLATNSG
jgi:hypothetical protein